MDLVTKKGSVESGRMCWLASLVSAGFEPVQCGWLSPLMCLACLHNGSLGLLRNQLQQSPFMGFVMLQKSSAVNKTVLSGSPTPPVMGFC